MFNTKFVAPFKNNNSYWYHSFGEKIQFWIFNSISHDSNENYLSYKKYPVESL